MPDRKAKPRSGPLVSVIMPVFNSGEYLEEAVRSVLGQTYRNLELIIVREHGSRDELVSLIAKTRDHRIILVQNQEKLGLARSLNEGIARSHGLLIARMDSDDISMPDRLEKQVDLLMSRKDVGVVGTHLQFAGSVPEHYDNSTLPTSPSMVRWAMHFQNAVAHPTVMFRREAWRRLERYSPEAEPCEDYELWLRAMRFTDIININEPLVLYRVRPDSVSSSRREEQNRKAMELAMKNIRLTLGKPIENRFELAALRPYSTTDPRDGVKGVHLIYMLYSNFLWWEKVKGDELRMLQKDAAKRISHIFVHTFKIGPLYAPMVLWQAARFGPRVFGRSIIEVIRRAEDMLQNGRRTS